QIEKWHPVAKSSGKTGYFWVLAGIWRAVASVSLIVAMDWIAPASFTHAHTLATWSAPLPAPGGARGGPNEREVSSGKSAQEGSCLEASCPVWGAAVDVGRRKRLEVQIPSWPHS